MRGKELRYKLYNGLNARLDGLLCYRRGACMLSLGARQYKNSDKRPCIHGASDQRLLTVALNGCCPSALCLIFFLRFLMHFSSSLQSVSGFSFQSSFQVFCRFNWEQIKTSPAHTHTHTHIPSLSMTQSL